MYDESSMKSVFGSDGVCASMLSISAVAFDCAGIVLITWNFAEDEVKALRLASSVGNKDRS